MITRQGITVDEPDAGQRLRLSCLQEAVRTYPGQPSIDELLDRARQFVDFVMGYDMQPA